MNDRERIEDNLGSALGAIILGKPMCATRYLGAAFERTNQSPSITNPDLHLRGCIINALWALETGQMDRAKSETEVAMSEVYPADTGIDPLLREQDRIRLERWSAQ